MKKIKLEKNSSIKINYDITYYLNPDYLYIPINVGNLLVHQNKQIYKNEIVEGNNHLKSPVSGIAYGLKKCQCNGKITEALVIENDFRELAKENNPKKQKVTIPNILKVLEENKNTALLNKFKSSKAYENIVISAINDNPYVYNKIFLLKENIIEVLELLSKLSLLYKSDNNLLVIKSNESFIIDEVLKVIGTYPSVTINLVEDEYLLGKEEYLLKYLGRCKNTLYLDISDLIYLKDALEGKISTTKLITISGDAIKDSKVLRVKKYTMLSDILDKYIDIFTSEYQIIVNGLMTGFKINTSDDVIITEKIDSINIMLPAKKPERKCINCGKCINVCPVLVNPLNGENKNKCIDCGLCTYICPAYINLREKLREGKNV